MSHATRRGPASGSGTPRRATIEVGQHMNIAYFRTSKHDRSETLARLRRAAEDAGLTIMGESALPNGKATVVTVCRPEWAETVIDTDPMLLGLLPCTVTVIEQGDATVVGAATPTLLGRAAPNEAILMMTEQAESTLRALVEAAAEVPPPKATQITLYSTHTCPYCNMEKAWLDRGKVAHEVVYIDDDQKAAEELVRRSGQQGVPQTGVTYDDGTIEYIVGFDKKKLEKVVATM